MSAPPRHGRGEPAGSPRRPLRPATRRTALGAAAALVLALGYADLARGGITVSAVLIVVGYCVLVPAAIVGGWRA